MKQLSNAELLEILRQDKEATPSVASAQTNLDSLDSQRDGNPASLPASRIPRLSQSPLTEGGLVAARTRHRAVKPLPLGDRSPFQLKLQKNPYGMYAVIREVKH